MLTKLDFKKLEEKFVTKSLFEARLAQLEQKLEQKLEEKLEEKLEQKLNEKLDEKLGKFSKSLVKEIFDLFNVTNERIDAVLEKYDEQKKNIDNHEDRIGRLENKVYTHSA